jgi:hypothetical protein
LRLAAAGLEPAIGLLHTGDDHRPSLALDFAEEFRPLIVDQVVLDLIRRNRLGPQHTQPDRSRTGGVLLTKAGREILLDAYERRMLQPPAAPCPTSPAPCAATYTGRPSPRRLARRPPTTAQACHGAKPSWSPTTVRLSFVTRAGLTRATTGLCSALELICRSAWVTPHSGASERAVT